MPNALRKGKARVANVAVAASRQSAASPHPGDDAAAVSALRAEVEALREAVAVKDRSLGMASHELLAPLAAMKAYIEALSENYDDPSFTETGNFLAVLDQETARLTRIVERMLDSARLGGGVALHLQPVLLADLVRQTSRGLMPLLEERGMRLELDVAVDLPVVQVDQDLLRQVMVNLIHNAIKFSAPGRRIWVQARDAGETTIEVTVRDEGFGIVPEEIGRIFDPYFRSGDDRVERQRGAGLGLAIVKTIVEQHGGSITTESQPDRGTTFRFTIPQA